jgi:hypothetical protein
MCIENNSFQGYASIHKSWGDKISEEEQWVKINIDRKRLSYTEKDKKVKLSLCLIKHYAMKVYGGWMYRSTFS